MAVGQTATSGRIDPSAVEQVEAPVTRKVSRALPVTHCLLPCECLTLLGIPHLRFCSLWWRLARVRFWLHLFCARNGRVQEGIRPQSATHC